MITAFFKPKNSGKESVVTKQTDQSPSAVSTASPPPSTPGQAPADDHRKRSNPYLKTGSGGGSSNVVVPSSSATSSSKRPKTNYVNVGVDTAVAAIVSALNDDSHKMNEGDGNSDIYSWKKSLNKHFAKPSFVRLAKFVQSERYVCTRIHPSVA